MPTSIVPFQPEHLPAVIRFAERTWTRPRTKEFYRWRFLDCPARTLLALRGDDCLGMLSTFESVYQIGDAQVRCAETFDWYCLPELRGTGLGILLMRALMERPEPLLVVGGSASTRALLPRLGWRRLATARSYTLPLTGQGLSTKLQELYGIPPSLTRAASDLSARIWSRSKVPPLPAGGTVSTARTAGDEVCELYGGPHGYSILPVARLSFVRWLMSGYGGGDAFVCLYFRIASRLRGWALGRVYPVTTGWEATLVDLYARHPDPLLYTWMISEVVNVLRPYHPNKITTLASCPILQAALRRNRFLRRGLVPVHVWSREVGFPPGPLHLMGNTGDWPFLPYPSAGI